MATDWSSERITAIVRLAVMLASMVAGGFGLAVDEDGVFTVVMCVVAAVAAIYSWWRNSNVTDAAIQAQHYLDAIKNSGDETDDES